MGPPILGLNLDLSLRGESYSVRYGEPLSEARTMLADFFSILLACGDQ